MKTDFTEAERYYSAQKKVKEIRGFYEHVMLYLITNPIVIVVNIMTSPGYFWFLWCLMGWGLAIVIHGLKVFNLPPFFDEKWEERKINEIMEKEKNNQQNWE
ncbi:2TM domain-containing protein [Flavobacterium procerum]|uniref:2TM domain-containing protein n=1 Tax=Flavobacterium procerum TaxID=1455569 RepID=A0ABV6BX84_9FLAO